MFKKYKKRKLKYKIVLGLGITVLLILVGGGVLLTPLGNGIIKKIIEDKIDKFIPGAEVPYLDYGINNFSLVVKKNSNIVKIYGTYFPINAMFDGNFEKIEEITSDLRGKMNVSGKIYKKQNIYHIDGVSFFAGGYLNFETFFQNGNYSFLGKGKEFELKRLLKMFYIDFPNIKGTTALNIRKENAFWNIDSEANGIFKRKINVKFNADSKIILKHKSDFVFKTTAKTDLGDFDLNGKVKHSSLECEFNISNLNLRKLKPLILFPLSGYVNIKGIYDSANNILKFKGKNFEGFVDESLEVTFKMNSKEFLKYLNITPVLKGNISGNVKIYDNKGEFDIVSDNSIFVKSRFVSEIYRLTGINLLNENKGKIFFKGNFNNDRVVFDMLCNDKGVSLNIKKGKYYYDGNYNFTVYLRNNNDIYKIFVHNNKYKILEKRILRDDDEKILVF